MVFGFMERGKAQHHIRTMARVLDVSPAGFYAHRVRPRSLRSFANEILGDIIARIHRESRGTYGSPRVQAELRLAHDIRCSRKRIARIMRQQGLQGVSRRPLHRTTVRDETAAPAPDLVGRDFRADAPNTLWVADITYVATHEGFLYLACVLDACSRRVVGWSMRTTLHSELVTSALDMALARQRPDRGLVHHSDRGCQYTSFAFGHRLKGGGHRPLDGIGSVTRTTTPSRSRSSRRSSTPVRWSTRGGGASPSAQALDRPRDRGNSNSSLPEV